MVLSSQQLWEALIERMDSNDCFGQAFNRRKAWSKAYYNLVWKSPEPHLLATYRQRDNIIRIGIYNDREEDLARIQPYIPVIEKDIGAEFKFRHRDGRASDYWLEYSVNDYSTLDQIIDWIVEWSLKIKDSIDLHVNGVDLKPAPVSINDPIPPAKIRQIPGQGTIYKCGRCGADYKMAPRCPECGQLVKA